MLNKASTAKIRGKSDDRFNQLISWLIILVGTLVVYGQLSSHAFTDFDDSLYIFDNSYVLDGLKGDSIKWAFTNTESANWHPLTWISHMVDRELFGSHTAAYILANAGWHAITGCLAFSFFYRLFKRQWLALFIVGIFILHPVNVEVVAWASQRKSLLSAFFWFISLLAYLDYVETKRKRSYIILCASFLLGLLAKAAGVSLPIILLLLDYWPLDRLKWNTHRSSSAFWNDNARVLFAALKEKFPLVILAGLVSIATFWAQHREGAVASMESLSLYGRFVNSAHGYMEYLGLYFWPNRLCVFYPREDIGTGQFILAAVVLLSVSCAAFHLWRKAPWFLFGWLWFLVVFLPMIGFVQVGSQAYADRYLYLPCFGLSIIVAFTWDSVVRSVKMARPAVLGSLALVPVLALTIKAYDQVGTWETGTKVFEHAIETTGASAMTLTNLGVSYSRDNRPDLALECFNQVPDEFRPQQTLGNRAFANLSLGHKDLSIALFEKALAIDPDQRGFHIALAMQFRERGELAKAVQHFDAAVKLLPTRRVSSLGDTAGINATRQMIPEFDKLRLQSQVKVSAAH